MLFFLHGLFILLFLLTGIRFFRYWHLYLKNANWPHVRLENQASLVVTSVRRNHSTRISPSFQNRYVLKKKNCIRFRLQIGRPSTFRTRFGFIFHNKFLSAIEYRRKLLYLRFYLFSKTHALFFLFVFLINYAVFNLQFHAQKINLSYEY